MTQLRPYQQAAVDAVYEHLRTRDDNPAVVLPTGCHTEGHPILMYDGTVKPVEQVRVGDEVMGPDSQRRRVLALCRGEDELFRITPLRGEPFVVNTQHVLSLVCTREGKPYPCSRQGGEIEHVTVAEYLGKPRSWKHLRKLYRVAIEFAEPRDLTIPPYVLGLLLGDGCLRQGCWLTTADEPLADSWERYADQIGCDVTVFAERRSCATYGLRRRRGKYNVLMEALEQLGLAEQDSAGKFIPHAYLTATRQDRLSLLAGLMDTDGSRNRCGFEITTKSRELAADIVFLARSLGFGANCRQKYCYCQTGAGGWFFRVHIYGDLEQVPCRLARKRAPPRRQKKSALRTGFSVEPCGRGPFYGFVLDGDHLYVDGHFMVHHNSGKSWVIAQLVKDAVLRWNGRVLVLAHVKELLEQNAEKIRRLCPEVPIGIYSAGLNRRETDKPAIVAGIQSVYRRACELDPFDLVIVDEAHLIPPDGEGMYRTFLAEAKVVNPHLRVIGLTATPFRLASGPICTPEGILNHICYEVGVRELIRDGYLCPLVTKAGINKADFDRLHIRGGEFLADEVENLMDDDRLVAAACGEIIAYTANRQAVLIFASGVRHAEHVRRVLQDRHGVECGLVTGETPAAERAELIARFRGETTGCLVPQPPLKYLVNVNVLTTGFDAPNIDCVAILRPTVSPGLWYQMVGRSFRLHPGKQNALVLDFGGNAVRHGPVDQLRAPGQAAGGTGQAPAKECPECLSVIAAGYACCPECGYEFPPPERQKHDARASTAGVLSGEVIDTEYEVLDVLYSVHTKRDAPPDAPKTMRVEYRIGLHTWISEWVCFEHTGYARWKAEKWWRRRSPDPVPDTAERAVEIAEAGGVAWTERIVVRSVAGEKFDRIVGYTLGAMPEPVPTEERADDLADVPF